MKTEIRVVAEEFKLPATNLPIVRYSIKEMNTSDDGIIVMVINPMGPDVIAPENDCLFKAEESFALTKMKDHLKSLKDKVAAIEAAMNKGTVYFYDGKITTKDKLYVR